MTKNAARAAAFIARRCAQVRSRNQKPKVFILRDALGVLTITERTITVAVEITACSKLGEQPFKRKENVHHKRPKHKQRCFATRSPWYGMALHWRSKYKTASKYGLLPTDSQPSRNAKYETKRSPKESLQGKERGDVDRKKEILGPRNMLYPFLQNRDTPKPSSVPLRKMTIGIGNGRGGDDLFNSPRGRSNTSIPVLVPRYGLSMTVFVADDNVDDEEYQPVADRVSYAVHKISDRGRRVMTM